MVAVKEGSERKYRFAGREGREEKKERKKKNLVLFASCLGCGEERGDIIIDLRNDQKSKGHEQDRPSSNFRLRRKKKKKVIYIGPDGGGGGVFLRIAGMS